MLQSNRTTRKGREACTTLPAEGVNAGLRHHLARKSGCSSRCLPILASLVERVVSDWNRRRFHHQRFPNYPACLLGLVRL